MNLTIFGSASYDSSLTRYRLLSFAQSLSKKDWRVSVIVPSADKYNNFKVDAHPNIAGITVLQPWQLRTPNVILNLLPYLCTGSVAAMRSKPDVIMVYKPTPVTLISLLPKLLYKAPLVLDLDDLGSEVMRLEGAPKLLWKLVAWSEAVLLEYASAVVVASSALQNIVEQKYPYKPVLLLSNGVDPKQYKVGSSESKQPTMYYFGAVNRLALVADMLKAMPKILDQVEGVHLKIIGGGSALDEAKQLVSSLGISQAVTFTGWIEPNEITDHVQLGDVALCIQPNTPTVQAASNLKVFQYMALGSVPVVSDVGDLATYILDTGRVVKPGDQEQLVDSVVELLKNSQLRTKLGLAARQRVTQKYDWNVLTKNLNDFLTELPASGAKAHNV